jgi:DNA-binding transcriptional ArsR family regulator
MTTMRARAGAIDVFGNSYVPMREMALPTFSVFAALANAKRLQILEWLEDPEAHFPPQKHGDLVEDGVCVLFIAHKLGVAQPTATAHLQNLSRAGLLTSKRVGQWTFYKRDEAAIEAFKQTIRDDL